MFLVNSSRGNLNNEAPQTWNYISYSPYNNFSFQKGNKFGDISEGIFYYFVFRSRKQIQIFRNCKNTKNVKRAFYYFLKILILIHFSTNYTVKLPYKWGRYCLQAVKITCLLQNVRFHSGNWNILLQLCLIDILTCFYTDIGTKVLLMVFSFALQRVLIAEKWIAFISKNDLMFRRKSAISFIKLFQLSKMIFTNFSSCWHRVRHVKLMCVDASAIENGVIFIKELYFNW